MLVYRNMKKVETNQFARREQGQRFSGRKPSPPREKQEKRECWKKWLSYYRMLDKKKKTGYFVVARN